MTLASYTSIYSFAKEVFLLIQLYHNLSKMWRLLFYILYCTCYTKLWNHCLLQHAIVRPFVQHPHDCMNTFYLTFSFMWDNTMLYKRETHIDYAYFSLNKSMSMGMTLRYNVLPFDCIWVALSIPFNTSKDSFWDLRCNIHL